MERRHIPALDLCGTGQNIKRIMRQRGLTVKDVQRFLELSSAQSIYHWLSGRSLPTVDHLYALSELFRLPVDEMLRGNREIQFYPYRSQAEIRYMLYYKKLSAILTDGAVRVVL